MISLRTAFDVFREVKPLFVTGADANYPRSTFSDRMRDQRTLHTRPSFRHETALDRRGRMLS